MPAQIVGFYTYLEELDADTFRELFSNACTHDEAIASAAKWLRTNKFDSRVHIRERGEYLAEVKYVGWNGGRVEVEDWREPGIIETYQLAEDGAKIYQIPCE